MALATFCKHTVCDSLVCLLLPLDYAVLVFSVSAHGPVPATSTESSVWGWGAGCVRGKEGGAAGTLTDEYLDE